MTFDEFYNKYLGKSVDYDGIAGVQCVDLADQYLKDVFGITGVWVNGAKDFYNNFNNYPALVNNFSRIPNTRELVVQKGDIIIWGSGKWGHVAIGTGEGNIDWFKSIEENTNGRHEPTQLVVHYFSKEKVLGVLRAKNQSKIIGNEFGKGCNYTLTEDMNIRKGPGISYNLVNYSDLTLDGKNHAVDGKPVLKEGTTVTALDVTNKNNECWAKIPSGWVCLCSGNMRFAK